ncbi:MAG: nucleotidyltransferase domain-containing protein [Sulfuriferula sp.]
MRLNPAEIAIIQNAFLTTFSEGTLYLFGSRVDDNKRGGDIDLLVEMAEPVANPALVAAQFSAKISRLMHGRKVDVLLSAPNLMRLPIHDIAFEQGLKL